MWSLDFKVSKLDRETGAWSHPETLDISTTLGDAHFDPIHNLIWGFDYPGGFGASDIWMRVPAASGDGEFANMGAAINTKYEETMPSATADGSLMFFNSDRPGGFGGMDVYEAVSIP